MNRKTHSTMKPKFFAPIAAFCLAFTAFLPLISMGAEISKSSLFGHYAYTENSSENLVTFNGIKVDKIILPDLKAMLSAAKKEGVKLLPRSGFRSVKRQHYLFYDIAKKRGQTLAERAKVSAPPGHSEHHTGQAIDFDDGDNPQFLNEKFAETKAGKWLMQNANTYNFHLSFPKNNTQGVTYEPWHWLWISPH